MASKPLIAVSIVERDKHGEALCTWMYPTLGDLEPVVISRSQMGADQVPGDMLFSKFKNTWIYCFPAMNTNHSDLPQVTAYSICVLSKVFDPEQHQTLLALMSKLYGASGDPLQLLNGYLSVFAKGSWEAQLEGKSIGKYLEQSDHRQALLASSLIHLVQEFGQETIYLWSALMMAKRVALYSKSIPKLQHMIRAIPLLAWHRAGAMWEAIRPFVCLDNLVEVADLQTTHFYVAGFDDATVQERSDLYDLFIDIDTQNLWLLITQLETSRCATCTKALQAS